MTESDYDDDDDDTRGDEGPSTISKSDRDDDGNENDTSSSQAVNKNEENARRWEDMFERLIAFGEEHGHYLVPTRYAKDRKLGIWVASQRRQYKIYISGSNGPRAMSPERAARLTEIGFEWTAKNLRCVPWEARFQQLLEFVVKNGHAHVPIGWEENVQLSNWVSAQRQEYRTLQKGKSTRLSQDRIDLLNSIGFVWEARKGGIKRNRDGDHVPLPQSHVNSLPDCAAYKETAKGLLEAYQKKSPVLELDADTSTATPTSESNEVQKSTSEAVANTATQHRFPADPMPNPNMIGQAQEGTVQAQQQNLDTLLQTISDVVRNNSLYSPTPMNQPQLDVSQLQSALLLGLLQQVPNLASAPNNFVQSNCNANGMTSNNSIMNMQPMQNQPLQIQSNSLPTQVPVENHQPPTSQPSVDLNLLSAMQSVLSALGVNLSSGLNQMSNAPLSGDTPFTQNIQAPVTVQPSNAMADDRGLHNSLNNLNSHNAGDNGQQYTAFPWTTNTNGTIERE